MPNYKFRHLDTEKRDFLKPFYKSLRESRSRFINGTNHSNYPMYDDETNRTLDFILPHIEEGNYADLLSGDAAVPLSLTYLSKEFDDIPDVHFYLIDNNSNHGLDIAQNQAEKYDLNVETIKTDATKPTWLNETQELKGITLLETGQCDIGFWHDLNENGNISLKDISKKSPILFVVDEPQIFEGRNMTSKPPFEEIENYYERIKSYPSVGYTYLPCAAIYRRVNI